MCRLSAYLRTRSQQERAATSPLTDARRLLLLFAFLYNMFINLWTLRNGMKINGLAWVMLPVTTRFAPCCYTPPLPVTTRLCSLLLHALCSLLLHAKEMSKTGLWEVPAGSNP